jgi:hypothetical protein
MIIGLSGYAQSGKDTIAKVLVEEYGYTRVAFADKIRELLYKTNPLVACSPSGYLRDLVDRVGWDEAKKESQVRKLLQDIGVAARETFGKNFWIEQAVGHFNSDDKIVFTDVRFKNEVERLKYYSTSQIWRVYRPGVSAVNSHVSESELEGYPFDHTIVNDSGLNDLKQTIGLLLK